MATGNNIYAAFYSISNGKICRQFQQPTENSKSRVNMNGKTVHEEFFDYIDGYITGIESRDSTYGKQWIVTLKDEIDTQVLQMNYSGGYAGAFLKTLPNVDFNEKVKIIPKLVVEGEKKKTTLFITQNGIPLKHYFTKDNPNKLPVLKKVKIKGKDVYDDSQMMEFLENMVTTEIVPLLKNVRAAKNGIPVIKTIEAITIEQEDDENKMPF